MLVGIDFGAKLAGSSVVAFIENGTVCFMQVPKKQDTDLFLKKWLINHKPAIIAIDAPLSLPKAYCCGENVSKDFFFRKSDKILGAMSPMFLGGLTARAIQLKFNILQIYPTCFIEVYPTALAKKWHLQELGYKKHISSIAKVNARIQELMRLALPPLSNWHQVDAILALCSAIRYQNNQAESFGEATEGLIWV